MQDLQSAWSIFFSTTHTLHELPPTSRERAVPASRSRSGHVAVFNSPLGHFWSCRGLAWRSTHVTPEVAGTMVKCQTDMHFSAVIVLDRSAGVGVVTLSSGKTFARCCLAHWLLWSLARRQSQGRRSMTHNWSRASWTPPYGLPFTFLPLTPQQFESHLFRVFLLRRLHLLLPVSSSTCQYGRPLDCPGQHRANCSKKGPWEVLGGSRLP